MSNETKGLNEVTTYMNADQRTHFTTLLEAQKQQIIEENQRTLNYLRDERIPTADLNDRASQEEEFAFELRIRNRELRLLEKINAALVRLRNHSYGWCEHCGEEIGIPRLQARPTSELCIRCKEKEEREERRYRDPRSMV